MKDMVSPEPRALVGSGTPGARQQCGDSYSRADGESRGSHGDARRRGVEVALHDTAAAKIAALAGIFGRLIEDVAASAGGDMLFLVAEQLRLHVLVGKAGRVVGERGEQAAGSTNHEMTDAVLGGMQN